MNKLNFSTSLRTALIAGVISAVINAVIFLIFHAAGVLSDDVLVQGQPITIFHVLISSVLNSIIAGVVFFLLDKYTSNGMKVFTIVSVILCALSFMNPFMAIPNVPLGYAMVLNAMHVVVAGALVVMFRRAKK